MNDENQNQGDEAEDGYIEMPPDPASPSAAAKAASDAAWAKYKPLGKAHDDAIELRDNADAAADAAWADAGIDRIHDLDAAATWRATAHATAEAINEMATMAREVADAAPGDAAAAKAAAELGRQLAAALEAADKADAAVGAEGAYRVASATVGMTETVSREAFDAVRAADVAAEQILRMEDITELTTPAGAAKAAAEDAHEHAANMDTISQGFAKVTTPLAEAAWAARDAADKAAADPNVDPAEATRLDEAADFAEAVFKAANEPFLSAESAASDARQAAKRADVAAEETLRMEGITEALKDAAAEDAGDVKHIEMDPEPAREQAEPDASSVKPTWWWGTDEEEAPPVDKPDASSATERVGPPGSEAIPSEEDTSRLIGGEALLSEDLRDETFSGEKEGGGALDAAAADAAVSGAAVGGAAAGAGGVEIEMPPDYVGRAGAEAAAQEPNNAPDPVAASPEELGQDAPAADPWAGTPPPGTTEQAGAEIVEGVEIEMPLDPGAAAKPGDFEELGQEQPSGEGPTAASTEPGGSPFWGVDETGPPAGDVLDYEQATGEGVEIEMPPDYVGQAGVDAGGVEIEVPPDPAETETPPDDHVEDVF